jgi:hypothetical protein
MGRKLFPYSSWILFGMDGSVVVKKAKQVGTIWLPLEEIYRLIYSFFVQMFCYVVEGILMLGVGTLGILLNIFSICFFIRQRTHRTFHRYS